MPKINTNCSYCQASLIRWPINPNTKLPVRNFFCNSTCKGKWQIAQREAMGFTKEWLKHQYLDLGKSANQIATEIGRDSKRVWEWITNYGLKTRARGHNTDHLPKDGSASLGMSHSAETKARLRSIALADGRLPWGKGNEPFWKGKFGNQHPCFTGGMTPERQAVYASKEWIDAVKVVWSRDNATCQRCDKHHNTAVSRGTFHIHHLVSFQVKELRTDSSNLVLLCKECHKFVHSKKNTEKQYIKELVTC